MDVTVKPSGEDLGVKTTWMCVSGLSKSGLDHGSTKSCEIRFRLENGAYKNCPQEFAFEFERLPRYFVIKFITKIKTEQNQTNKQKQATHQILQMKPDTISEHITHNHPIIGHRTRYAVQAACNARGAQLPCRAIIEVVHDIQHGSHALCPSRLCPRRETNTHSAEHH